MEVSGRKYDDLHEESNSDSSSILCQPCHNDGDDVAAEGYCEICCEHLCSVCLKVHRKQSATKNHVIKSKDAMPRVQIQTDPCSELCTIHRNEVVKFYCRNHDEVGCGDCMVLDHKVCEVKLVPDVSGDYAESEEPEQIKRKIEYLLQEITSRKQEIKTNMAAAAEINMKVVREIKQFRSELNSYLDRVEGELLREAEQLKTKQDTLQNKLRDEYTQIEKEMNTFQSSFEKHSGKINQLFVSAKLAQKKLQMFQNFHDHKETDSEICSYKFEPSKDLMTLENKNTHLGTLSVIEKVRMVNMKAKFERKLNVKAVNEKEMCWITGLAMLSCDEILLADCNNSCLKVLNVKENKIASKYSIPKRSSPWDVTAINTNTAAVTVPCQGKILFMNTRNKLSESHSLKVRNNCKGIDHRNGHLAVSFCWPPAVQILNMKGDIQHEVSDTSMFGYPGHIGLSSDCRSVFVSEHGNHGVFELSIDGKLKATVKCEDLTNPRGLTVTSDGTVVVCFEGSSDRVSMVVPNTRETLPLTLEHVQYPTSILICEKQKKIYVCESSNSKDCNNVKIFVFEL